MADPFDVVAAAAAPAKSDPFDAVAAHATPVVAQDAADPFDAVAAHAQQGYAVQAVPQAPNQPIEDQVVNAIGEAIPDSVKGAANELGKYISQSPVGTAMSYLNKPMEAASAAITYGLDKTVSPGIQQALNPSDSVFPHIAYHDILNYELPTNDKVEENLKAVGIDANTAKGLRLGYATVKTLGGLGADLMLDPVNLVAAGAGTALSKAGEVAGKVPALAKAGEKAAVAGNKLYDRTIGLFDYRTGYQDVDNAAGIASALKRGDNVDVMKNFYEPIKKLNLSKEENAVLSKAVESTHNAANTRDIYAAAKNHPSAANIADGRLEQIANAGVQIKAANAEDIAARVGAGMVDEKDVAEKTIENYLVHKISPEAKVWARKNPELAAQIQENVLKNEAKEVVNGSWMNDFDSGKMARNIQKPLDEANAQMRGATKGAVDEWFITDPAVSTAMKISETRKIIRDKQLLEVMGEHAISGDEARKLGLMRDYKSIKHDYFDGKSMSIKGGTQTLPFNEVYFPNKIADKIGYMIAPREIGNISKFAEAYNRVFRTFALAKADYYIQNWGENFFKNYVVGVKIGDYKDAWKLASEKGFINIQGKNVAVKDIMKDVTRYGIDSGGQFNEGIQSVLYTGKKLAADSNLSKINPMNVVKVLRHAGEKGENYTRRALFINGLKKGMSAEESVLNVEKYLFDFSRNTKATDAARRFFDPFIQASVKTAIAAPDLLRRNPKAYNFIHNNLPNAIAAAFNDPMTTQEVLQVIPQYRQYQDPIVGPLLTGNDWLYKIFTNTDTPKHLGGKTAVLFKTPIGMDILNRFALWDSQTVRNSATVSPILKSLVVAFGGKDPFTGKNLDITSAPDMARRLNTALSTLAESAVPMPNTTAFFKEKLGIGDPKYFTPWTVKALQSNFGKFVTITNLDKEYFFKNIAMATARKAMVTELRSSIMKEQTGRTADLSLSGPGAINKAAHNVYQLVNNAYGSAYVYGQLQENRREMFLTKLAAAGMTNELKAAEMVKSIREIDVQIKQLNQQYSTASDYRLMVLRAAKDEGDKEMEQVIVPEATPQTSDQ